MGYLFGGKIVSDPDGSDRLQARFGATVKDTIKVRPDLSYIASSLVTDWNIPVMKDVIQIIGKYDLTS